MLLSPESQTHPQLLYSESLGKFFLQGIVFGVRGQNAFRAGKSGAFGGKFTSGLAKFILSE
jgi:hypothetical protein